MQTSREATRPSKQEVVIAMLQRPEGADRRRSRERDQGGDIPTGADQTRVHTEGQRKLRPLGILLPCGIGSA